MSFARRMRSVSAVAALLALAACSPLTGGGHTAAPSGSPAPSATGGRSGAGSAIDSPASGSGGSGSDRHGGPLSALVPYPAGARPWSADRTGTFALAPFVREFYVKSAWTSEEGLMRRRGFVSSARHAWIGSDGAQDDVWLVDFRTAVGARSMYLGLTSAWKHPASSVTDFSDPAVHGSGQSTTALDSLGNANAKVAAVRGHLVVYVKVYTAAAPDRPAAVALMRRQFDRLSG